MAYFVRKNGLQIARSKYHVTLYWWRKLRNFGCILNHSNKTTMAESSKTLRAKRRGGRYCVAGTPNQRSCQNTSFTPGIHMHHFPSDLPVRAQWVQFVRRHRHDYKDPTSKYASLCSAHFDESCYERKMSVVRSVKKEYKLEMRVFLKPTAVPTRDSVTPQSPEKISQRGKRKVRISYVYTLISSDLCYSSSPTYFSLSGIPATHLLVFRTI